MKYLVLILLSLSIAAGLAVLAVNDTGMVLVSIYDWTIQASLFFIIACLVILFTFLYIGIRLLARLVSLPRDYSAWQHHRRREKSGKYLDRGLLALVEGRWKDAEQALIKGAGYSDSPLIYYLCAARAAQGRNRTELRDYYLSLARETQPRDSTAIGLLQAELQSQGNQSELALATLSQLDQEQPAQKHTKLMLLKTSLELSAWRDALNAIPYIQRHKLLPAENIMAAQLEAYAGLLQESGETGNINRLEKAWLEIPRNLRRHLHLIEIYTQEKLRFADTETCEPLLKKAIKRQWDTEIVRLYGLVQGEDPVRQLNFAESLLGGHARDPVLLLTLGRLAKRNSLWGKAAGYFKESIQLEARPETYRELALLLEMQGDFSAASSYYQQGLALATDVQKHESVRMLEENREQDAATAGARQVV